MDWIRFRALRREVGLTQQEVADALGVSRRTVIRWERGECRIPIKKECEFTYLIGDHEWIDALKGFRPAKIS